MLYISHEKHAHVSLFIVYGLGVTDDKEETITAVS